MDEHEKLGNKSDLEFLSSDAHWLHDTEVRYRIRHSKSRWHVSMIFIAVDNPMKFLCRNINSYESENKALTYARIFQRGIQKDVRGTLKTDENAFNICQN